MSSRYAIYLHDVTLTNSTRSRTHGMQSTTPRWQFFRTDRQSAGNHLDLECVSVFVLYSFFSSADTFSIGACIVGVDAHVLSRHL
jgi:hypothetical protein